MTILNCENINLYYGQNHALKNINLNIEPFSVTALIGPSGCGKSTFLRCINRMNDLIPETRVEGKIILEGKDIYSPDTDVNLLRRKVGMVFQKPTPFQKSIFDNVAYGLLVNGTSNSGVIKEKVEGALKQAALWNEVKDSLHKSATQLSGGQQQRLCIARMIAVEPNVVLMDEPTSALDPISTSKIEELIVELRKTYTIIIVTHNMQQARRISDHTAFFYMGELGEFNTTSHIFNNSSLTRTQNYVNGIFG
jgi:phosphate transport system ATP-binding protein